jgi:hypothetical protein
MELVQAYNVLHPAKSMKDVVLETLQNEMEELLKQNVFFNRQRDYFMPDGQQTTFQLHADHIPNTENFFANGLLLTPGVDYVEQEGTIVFQRPLEAGDRVVFEYNRRT